MNACFELLHATLNVSWGQVLLKIIRTKKIIELFSIQTLM